MKVYILGDMEGISLVYLREQVKAGYPPYPRFQQIYTRELNAAVEGAFAAGATEVIINDGHGGGQDYNLLWEGIDSRAQVERPDSSTNILPSLDETFDAMLLVGYHAMEGTPNAILAHTQSSARWRAYTLNGRPYGEIGQMALIAGDKGVPVAYISGDRAAVVEARDFLGDDLPGTIVKRGHPNGRTRSLHPCESAKRIRADVEQALQKSLRRPFYFPGPYDIKITFKASEFAAEKAAHAGIERVDPYTVAKTVQSAQKII